MKAIIDAVANTNNPFSRLAATLRARSHAAEQKQLSEERKAEQQRMVEFAHG